MSRDLSKLRSSMNIVASLVKISTVLLLTSLLVIGCASSMPPVNANLAQENIRSAELLLPMQTRVFSASEEASLNAMIDTLENSGYFVNSASRRLGFLAANNARNTLNVRFKALGPNHTQIQLHAVDFSRLAGNQKSSGFFDLPYIGGLFAITSNLINSKQGGGSTRDDRIVDDPNYYLDLFVKLEYQLAEQAYLDSHKQRRTPDNDVSLNSVT